MLAIDTSRSMGATDISPSRLAAAQNAAYRFVDIVPKKFRSASSRSRPRAQLALAPTPDRDLVREAIGSLHAGRGNGDRRRRRPLRPRSARSSAQATARTPADHGAADLRRRPRRRRRPHRAPPRSAPGRCTSPCTRSLVGTPNGVVRHQLPGGYTETIRVPPSPQTLQLIANTTGGQSFRAASDDAAARGLREPRLAARAQDGNARDHRPVRRRRRGAAADRRRPVGALVPEGGVRYLLLGAARARRADGGAFGRSSDQRVPGPEPVRPGRRAVGGRPDRGHRAAAAGAVPAHLPEGLRRRGHRRGAQRPGDRPLVPRRVRDAGLARRDHLAHDRVRRLLRRRTTAGTDLPAARRAASRRRAAAAAHRPPSARSRRPDIRRRGGWSRSASAANPRSTPPAAPTSGSSAGTSRAGSPRRPARRRRSSPASYTKTTVPASRQRRRQSPPRARASSRLAAVCAGGK